MKDYKRGSHTVWDCKYHLVWTTKYRYEVLGGDVGLRCRELLREIAMSQELGIYAGSINRDHAYADKHSPSPVRITSGSIFEGGGRVLISCCQSISTFGNGTGGNTYGREAIGSDRVAM